MKEARAAQVARREGQLSAAAAPELEPEVLAAQAEHKHKSSKRGKSGKSKHKSDGKKKKKSSKSSKSSSGGRISPPEESGGSPFYLGHPNEASWAAASLGKRPDEPRTVRLDKKASGYGLVFNSTGLVTGYGSGPPNESSAAVVGIPRGALIIGVDGVGCTGRDEIVTRVKAAAKAGRASVAFVLTAPAGGSMGGSMGGYSGGNGSSYGGGDFGGQVSPHATSASSHPYDPTQAQGSTDHELVQTFSAGLSRVSAFVSSSDTFNRAKGKIESTSVGRDLGGMLRNLSGGHEPISQNGGGGGGLAPDVIGWNSGGGGGGGGYHGGAPGSAWAMASRPGIKARTISLRAQSNGQFSMEES